MHRYKIIFGCIFFAVFLFILPSPVSNRFKSLLGNISEPFLSYSSGAFKGIGQIRRIPGWIKERERMERQLDSYQQKIFEIEELKLENDRIRSLLGLRSKKLFQDRNVVMAEIIGRSPSGWSDTVLIDQGSAVGLKNGIPVMTHSGLLGRVEETGNGNSRVQLITHPRFRIGALVQRTRHGGIVYGTVSGECRMKYLPLDADVRPGDLIETAGLSENIPKGLLIGEVTDVWKEPGQLYKVAALKLFADLHRLEEVICVLP
jgi:rod shape-determining protein MreC